MIDQFLYLSRFLYLCKALSYHKPNGTILASFDGLEIETEYRPVSSEKMDLFEAYVRRATKPQDKSSLRQISLR